MYKYLLAVVLILLVSVEMSARRISEDEAYQKAAQFMGVRSAMSPALSAMSRSETEGSYYAFNRSGGGFVIVSASDLTDSIIGYSRTGMIAPENIPENFATFMKSHAEILEFAEQNNIDCRSARSRSQERANIEPLVETRWNQWYPYNMFCHTMDGQPAPSGCVAVTMAQIMAYHKSDYFPEGIFDNNCDQVFDFDTCRINYDNLCPTYSFDGYETEEQKTEVARLMKICGYMANMQYYTNESRAHPSYIMTRLVRHYNYDESADFIWRMNYDNQEDWENDIYESLAHSWPVPYDAQNAYGSGHSWVCDGYEDGYFHMNWGWGGACDGYFKIAALQVADKDYNCAGWDSEFWKSHRAIINLRPKGRSGEEDDPATIEDIQAEGHGTITIYDLTGRLNYSGNPDDANSLLKGIYIVRNGRSVRKILVR